MASNVKIPGHLKENFMGTDAKVCLYKYLL